MSEFSEASIPKIVSFDQRATEAPDHALTEIIRRGSYPENQYDFIEGQNMVMFFAWPYAMALEDTNDLASPETNNTAFQGIYFTQQVADYLLGERVDLPYPHDRTIDREERRAWLLAHKDEFMYANPTLANWIQRTTTSYNFSPWRKLVFETVTAAILKATEDAERHKYTDFLDITNPPENL